MSVCASFLVLFSLLTYGLIVVDNRIKTATVKNGVIDYSGTLGDLIGGVLNPVLALFGILAGGLAFYAQYNANKLIQDQFKIQQFESQFYEMLRLHKENVNEMKISGYDYNNSISYNKKTGEEIITRNEVERFVEGRKVFVSMVKELIACYEFCKLYDITNKYETQDLLELSYRIFFFGSSSSLITSQKIDTEFIRMIKDQLKLIRNQHKESVGGVNEFETQDPKKNIKLHIKYAPFTGHENRLGHYYRHLYGLVKFVVNNEKNGLFSYLKSREYLKIVRGQMANDEQLMLYYNYRIGFGGDWDYKGKSGNEYFTKYRVLHNLPIDKIRYAESPRKHFENFIELIKNDNDPLFEWGDN
ncbi:putative phage abortive infection protein [Flavobacterium sp.]|uniref:putative phage abortive infection protein n=1 Tax=Flavobacterium sp. TaxID=239 RepID=UPI00391904E2